MKWKQRYFRIKKKFALFPIKFDEEYIWLEMIYLKQSLSWSRWKCCNYWKDVGRCTRKEYLEWKRKLKGGTAK